MFDLNSSKPIIIYPVRWTFAVIGISEIALRLSIADVMQSERKVALTFDDGPNEPYTSEVLNVLRERHVRATFFLTGMNVQTYPETAREIVRQGHEIGNHSYSHHDLVFHTNSTVRREI